MFMHSYTAVCTNVSKDNIVPQQIIPTFPLRFQCEDGHQKERDSGGLFHAQQSLTLSVSSSKSDFVCVEIFGMQ